MNEWTLLIVFMLLVIFGETCIFAASQYAQSHQPTANKICECKN